MRMENMRTLDLHGFNYEEVVLRCHEFLNANYGHDMFIITGNSNEMKKVVTEVIEKYRLRYLSGGITGTDGFIRVYRKKDA